jgi:adenine-specific DNA-methyltransferase
LKLLKKVSEPRGVFSQGLQRAFARAKRGVNPPRAAVAARYLLAVLRRRHGTKHRFVSRCTTEETKALNPLVAFVEKLPLTTAAYVISTLYAHLIDEKRKRLMAMYFTPPALADHLVQEVMAKLGPDDKGCFLDPASGGAAFLLPIAIHLRDKLKRSGARDHAIVSAIRARLRGVERDSVLARLAQSFVEIALVRELRGRRLARIVTVGDSLALSRRSKLPKANYIVCNPPYRKLAASERAWYLRHYPDIVTKQPNLYSLFVAACTSEIGSGGHLMLLTPTSYLSGPSFTPIRKLLSEKLEISELHLLEDRENVFHRVEHDLCAIFAERMAGTAVEKKDTKIASWSERRGTEFFGSLSLPTDGTLWSIPRDVGGAARNQKWFDSIGSSLEAYGYVPRVGPYVWNRDPRRKLLATPKGRLRRKAVPILWASHIRRGKAFRFVATSRNVGRARFIVPRAKDASGFLTQGCVLIQRTSTRAQKNRLLATAVPDSFFRRYRRAVAENHVIALLPVSNRPAVSPKRLANILNQATVDRQIAEITGTANITVDGLKRLRLPDVKKKRQPEKRSRPFRSAHIGQPSKRPTRLAQQHSGRLHEEARPT